MESSYRLQIAADNPLQPAAEERAEADSLHYAADSLQTAAATFPQLTADRAAGIEAAAAGASYRVTSFDGPWLKPISSSCLDASGVSDVSSLVVLSATFEGSFSSSGPVISGGGGTETAMASTVAVTTGDVAAVAAAVAASDVNLGGVSGGEATATAEANAVATAVPTANAGCRHDNVRRGGNQYGTWSTCKDCGEKLPFVRNVVGVAA